MAFHHDALSIQVPDIKFFEFLVHALSKHACKSHTVSAENSLYLLLSNTWFSYWQ